MLRPMRLAALLLATASLPGCAIFCALCPQPLPKSPAKGDRDTPERAVDYLVDAFRRDAINDLFESLDADFVADQGGFSAQEFSAAYTKYREDFQADAESLAAARRTKPVIDADGIAWITLVNDGNGAEALIGFVDRPKVRIVTKDEWVGEISGRIDKTALVRIDDGKLVLPPSYDLTKIPGVEKQTVAGLAPGDILRVEIHDDWLVRFVPQDQAKHIRFLVKLKELMGP